MDVVTYALAKNKAAGYTDSKFDAVSSGVTYKGSVSSVEDLPTTATKGDEYSVGSEGYYVYDGTQWVPASKSGPKGDPGEEGPQGPQGEPGRDGANSVDAGTNISVEYDSTEKKYTINNTMEIVNNVSSSDTGKALSANMGKDLNTEISNLKNIGRFCAIWDAEAGAPTSEPLETPYIYKTGDYFRIGTAGYKVPTGSQYNPGEYDLAEEETGIGDVWYYDSVEWVKQASSGGGTVQDVQVNGTSILSGGVANIPIAGSELGVVKVNTGQGLAVNPSAGNIYITAAPDSNIVAKNNNYQPITPNNLDKAVMEGLGNNSLTWSAAYKAAAQATIGLPAQTSFTCEMADGTTKTLTLNASLV